jgi:hypothetical protein
MSLLTVVGKVPKNIKKPHKFSRQVFLIADGDTMDRKQRREKINAVARELKCLMEHDFLSRGAGWTLAWLQFDLKWSDGDPGYLTIPLEQLEPFAKAAEADDNVLQLAKYLVGTRLRAGVKVPHPIGVLVAPALLEALPDQKRKSGGIRVASRNFAIFHVMRHLIDIEEMTGTVGDETWNHRTREIRASEFVYEALQIMEDEEIEFKKITLKTLQTIWARTSNQADYDELNTRRIWHIFDDDPDCIRV